MMETFLKKVLVCNAKASFCIFCQVFLPSNFGNYDWQQSASHHGKSVVPKNAANDTSILCNQKHEEPLEFLLSA